MPGSTPTGHDHHLPDPFQFISHPIVLI
jgi:hypothetical protein